MRVMTIPERARICAETLEGDSLAKRGRYRVWVGSRPRVFWRYRNAERYAYLERERARMRGETYGRPGYVLIERM